MTEGKKTQSDVSWSTKFYIQLENIRKWTCRGVLIKHILECWISYNFLCPDKSCYDKRLAGLVGKLPCTLYINCTTFAVSTLCSNKQDNNDKLSKQSSDMTLNWKSSNLMKTKARWKLLISFTDKQIFSRGS